MFESREAARTAIFNYIELFSLQFVIKSAFLK